MTERRHTTDRLTPAERKWVGEYLRTLADKLGLRDWCLHVEHAIPESEGAIAEAFTPYGRRHGYVRFRGDFVDQDAEEQRSTCIHELLHLHFDQLDWFFTKTVEEMLGPTLSTPIIAGYRQQQEYIVDALADEIAPYFPLPPALERDDVEDETELDDVDREPSADARDLA